MADQVKMGARSMAKKTKKVEALKSTAGRQRVPVGRKAGESQLDYLKVPDPPKPPVKR
jgi:hypothetical protein